MGLIGHDRSGELSVIASAAIEPGLRVKWHSTAGEIIVAGDEACIGVTKTRALAAGDGIVILDIKSLGSLPFTSGGVITVGDAFTSAAAGKVVTGTGGAEDYGIALTTTTADGGQVEGTSGL